MRVLLGRPPNSPEAMRLQIQIDAATKMYEVYYAKKAENLDLTGERAAKCEFNLKNVSVPYRLTTQIHEWDLINGGSYVRMGATPNWTSVEALQQLEAMQNYNDYHGFKKQKLEYLNQLIKEIQAGIVIETDNIRIFNPTFLIPKPGGKQRKILDCRNINQLTTLL
ncbi:MAG: hypothetical protein EZS28_026056, partial [Streblomastix strix]